MVEGSGETPVAFVRDNWRDEAIQPGMLLYLQPDCRGAVSLCLATAR